MRQVLDQPPARTGRLRGLHQLVVFAALGSVPFSRVRDVFHPFSVVEGAEKHLRWSGEEEFPVTRVGSFRELRINSTLGVRRNGIRSFVGIKADRPVYLSLHDANLVREGPRQNQVLETYPVDVSTIMRSVDILMVDRIRDPESLAARVQDVFHRWLGAWSVGSPS